MTAKEEGAGVRNKLFVTVVLIIGGIGQAQSQNSTTNCDVLGNTLNCNTNTQSTPGIDWGSFNQQQRQINQQNQQNLNNSMENLGAAIAADRERKRQRREAEAARLADEAEQAARRAREEAANAAMQVALAADNGVVPPVPAERPVILACKIEGYSMNLALYEKTGRVDVTERGVTKSRAGIFTSDTVSWRGSVWRSAVSRIDMSITSVAILPELGGAQVSGNCVIAERKF